MIYNSLFGQEEYGSWFCLNLKLLESFSMICSMFVPYTTYTLTANNVDGEKLPHEYILTRSSQKETRYFCESLHLEISVKSSRVLMGSSNNAAARELRRREWVRFRENSSSFSDVNIPVRSQVTSPPAGRSSASLSATPCDETQSRYVRGNSQNAKDMMN